MTSMDELRVQFAALQRASDAIDARERAHGAGDAALQRDLRALLALDAELRAALRRAPRRKANEKSGKEQRSRRERGG